MEERKYFSIVTDVGMAAMTKAFHDGVKIDMLHYAVGDGGGFPYTPTSNMTQLKNEVWRGDITNYEISAQSPNVIRVDSLLPSDEGGFTIREMGLFDSQNRLIAVANTADIVKVRSIDGMQTEIALSMSVALANKETLNFPIDTNLVYVSKKDLNGQIRQRDIVIPTTGWKEDAEGGAGGGYLIEIMQKDVTEKMIPIVSIFHNSMDTARDCGMSTIAETMNGVVRLFVETIPKKEINASLILLRASNSIATDGIADNNMNVEEFYKNYVATSEDLKEVFNDVFQK